MELRKTGYHLQYLSVLAFLVGIDVRLSLLHGREDERALELDVLRLRAVMLEVVRLAVDAQQTGYAFFL